MTSDDIVAWIILGIIISYPVIGVFFFIGIYYVLERGSSKEEISGGSIFAMALTWPVGVVLGIGMLLAKLGRWAGRRARKKDKEKKHKKSCKMYDAIGAKCLCEED